MKKISKLLALVLLISLTGCLPPPKSTKTALELQSFQAKEFETTKKIAFASTLSVLQDHGYIIGSASLDTGLISGKSPTNSANMFFYKEMTDVKSTAFVEEITVTVAVQIAFKVFKEASSNSAFSCRMIFINDTALSGRATGKVPHHRFCGCRTVFFF